MKAARMKTQTILATLSLAVGMAGYSLPPFAQGKPVVTDEGEINVEAAAKAFPKQGFSPYANRNYPTRVLWGDEHVHTGWSVDAGAFGCTLGPEEALRFARGEQVKSSLGEPAKLSRPLDWVAITDHSDAAGVIFEIRDGNPNLMARSAAKRWHDMMSAGKGVEAASEMIAAQSNNQIPAVMKDPKLAMVDLAEEHRHHGEIQRAGAVHRASSATSGRAMPAAATTCIAT